MEDGVNCCFRSGRIENDPRWMRGLLFFMLVVDLFCPSNLEVHRSTNCTEIRIENNIENNNYLSKARPRLKHLPKWIKRCFDNNALRHRVPLLSIGQAALCVRTTYETIYNTKASKKATHVV